MTTQQIKQSLAMLFASYPSAGEGPGELKTQLGLCEVAVSGVPADFVERACMAFIQGNVDGHNPSFRPKPAELAAYARKLFNRDHSMTVEARRIQQQLEAPKEPEPTAEERASAIQKAEEAKCYIASVAASMMLPTPKDLGPLLTPDPENRGLRKKYAITKDDQNVKQ